MYNTKTRGCGPAQFHICIRHMTGLNNSPLQFHYGTYKIPKENKTRMMFIKHYAPNRCLCIKVANSIDHWVEDCRDVTKAGGRGICTKNGSYCKKEKKSGGGGGSG